MAIIEKDCHRFANKSTNLGHVKRVKGGGYAAHSCEHPDSIPVGISL
jgi:hypothetical protein